MRKFLVMLVVLFGIVLFTGCIDENAQILEVGQLVYIVEVNEEVEIESEDKILVCERKILEIRTFEDCNTQDKNRYRIENSNQWFKKEELHKDLKKAEKIRKVEMKQLRQGQHTGE